jgi:hypothetical protein
MDCPLMCISILTLLDRGHCMSGSCATGLDRQAVKRRLLVDVFGRRGLYPSPVEDAFQRLYPTVHQFIRSVNRDGRARLLRRLQRAEADFTIRRVGERLARTGGACPSRQRQRRVALSACRRGRRRNGR